MKRLCEDCRAEIKTAPPGDDQRCFCSPRCQDQWRRRMARFNADRRQPVAFGDA